MKQLNTLTPEQLYAFEQFARRERAKAQARMVLAAVQWVKETAKTIFFRPYAKRAARKAAFNG